MRILLVDDEALLRVVMGLSLQKRGFHVDLAADGREALTLIRSGGPYDTLVVDIFMPLMGGPELVKNLWSNGSRVPVILIGGDREALSQHNCRHVGVTGTLLKPFRVEELVSAILAGTEKRSELEG